jgi:hypothetical protein
MELGLIGVYNKAVRAVPAIRYALGVSGVIAAAMIALNVATSNPGKAVLAFIFVLAGMYLLLIFASIKDIAKKMEGPVTVIIWSLTLLFIASLALTFSAFAIGKPEVLAKLVGAIPATARESIAESVDVIQQTKSESPPSTKIEDHRPLVAPPPASPQKAVVQEIFQFSDSSDDCGANQTKRVEFCMSSGAKVMNWSGPNISSANCGSQVTNITISPGQENCVLVETLVRGCGYDNLLFGIRNCRGRGWLTGSITLNGEK